MNKVSWNEYNGVIKTSAAESYAKAYAEGYGLLKSALDHLKIYLVPQQKSLIKYLQDDSDESDRYDKFLGDVNEDTKKRFHSALQQEDKVINKRFQSALNDIEKSIKHIDETLRKGEETTKIRS